MKRIQYIGVLACAAATLLFSSCSNEFLDRKPTSALDTQLILGNPDYVQASVVGTMRTMYGSGFGGRDATVIGDMMTDMVTSAIRGSNGTLKTMEEWNINSRTTEVASFWANGYAIAASAARTIQAANTVINEGKDVAKLQNTKAVSLVAKVYAEYFLTQYFCVDVNLAKNDYQLNAGKTFEKPGNNSYYVGIILLRDRALRNDEAANMSTLEATYAFMEEEINTAIELFEESKTNTFSMATGETRYFPTLCAAYVMKARLALAQHKYQEAAEAADNALANLPAGANANLIDNGPALLKAYGENPSSEDIWLLNYTSSDNLSANSLQNLFSSYGSNPSDDAISLFQSNDIRRALYYKGEERNVATYCLKYPNPNSVFNVPLLRVPEIYLIQAEAKAATGDLTGANDALVKVLGVRDTSIKGDVDEMVSKYKITDQNIMKVVLDENAREFLCEGHRWSDLRRNGMRLTRNGSLEKPQYQLHFQNYPLSTFAFPVPYDETTTEAWKKGKGLISDNNKDTKNWNNNAWDDGPKGDVYNARVTLPAEGLDYKNNAF